MGRLQKPGARTEGSEKVARWRNRLIEAGGSRKTIPLSPEATRALARAIRHHSEPISEAAFIEKLILKAGERRTKPR